MALAVVKEMQVDGLDWGGEYRPLARRALADVIESQLAMAVDRHLEDDEDFDPPEQERDRRNGSYRRTLLTGPGDIHLCVPRTRDDLCVPRSRRWSPCAALRAYARREAEIDRVILTGFMLGLSTRKLGEALLPMLGRPVSPATVSRVAKTLDGAVAAFHERPLGGRYRALILDGVVLSRKTGAGAL